MTRTSFGGSACTTGTNAISLQPNPTQPNPPFLPNPTLHHPRSVAEVLERNEALLRTVFEFYATGQAGGKRDDAGSERSLLLSIDEWTQLLSDADLFDSDFTREKALLCFKWSQTFITDEVKRSEALLHLTFVEFLEALGRVCTMKPLPTAEMMTINISRSVAHFYSQADDGVHGGNEVLRRPLEWQEEESSEESLRPALETLVSLILERLSSSETLLTRKALRARLITKQKKRERLRAAQMAKQPRGGGSPRGLLGQILSKDLA